jgi:hypothetical protein
MTDLSLLKVLYRDEARISRLTTTQPPVVRYVTRSRAGAYDVEESGEPADRIGENLSAPLVLLIGGIIGRHDSERCAECLANPLKAEDSTRYGPRHPVRRALMDFERLCRRRHRLPTWTDHAAGPVCALMLRGMLERDESLAWVADLHDVSYPRAERLVAAGLEYVARWVEHWDHESRDIATDRDCPVCRARKMPIDLRARITPVAGVSRLYIAPASTPRWPPG